MGVIFYSVAGEGRGHATRARAMIECLRERHEVRVFAPAQAFELLAPLYRNTSVQVEEIPGLLFHYTAKQRVHYLSTGLSAMRYMRGMPKLVRSLQAKLEEAGADLVISDFEPALPRAARRAGVPVVSLDHQSFLVVSDLSELPKHLRRHVGYMSWVVNAYYKGQRTRVTSSFYFPPLKKKYQDVHQIGVLLRPDILAAKPEMGDHLCVYLRRFNSPSTLRALQDLGVPARVYGLGEKPSEGNVQFRPIDEKGFLEDLATSRALVCTAGNQLVGEALFLGKPVLAMPEEGNREQAINAHFLVASKGGESCPIEQVDAATLRGFLDRWPTVDVDRDRLNGTEQALAIVERLLRPIRKLDTQTMHREVLHG